MPIGIFSSWNGESRKEEKRKRYLLLDDKSNEKDNKTAEHMSANALSRTH